MQPIKILANWLYQHANSNHYLFTPQDLRALSPHLSDAAFTTLLSRAVSANLLIRICRGLFVFEQAIPSRGHILYHAAGYLRADKFNYLSLESVLSDAGVISQMPINRIMVISSGRSNIISCGRFGEIEFVHTSKKPTDIINEINYDPICKLWRANVALALHDMKLTHRSCDLIDWEIVNELIR